MKIINRLSDEVTVKAKDSPRLKMRSTLPLCYSKNYNFRQSLEDKCHQFLNAVEPETNKGTGARYTTVERLKNAFGVNK